MFGYVGEIYGSSYPCSGVTMGSVTKPAEKIIILDGSVGYACWDWTYPSPAGLYGAYYSFEGNCSMLAHTPFINYLTGNPTAFGKAFIHNNGVNCTFADGHAKWLTGSNMLGKGQELMHPWR